MATDSHTIIYTHTDEAPALATKSLLPVVNAFTNVAGVTVASWPPSPRPSPPISV